MANDDEKPLLLASNTSYGATAADVPGTKITSEEQRSVKWLRILNLGLMSCVVFGCGMCVSLFAPFYPPEAEKRGVSSTVVGFLFSSILLVMLIGSLVSGVLVRVLGLTFMLGSGTLLAGGTTLLFGVLDWSPPGNVYVALLFLVRSLEGVGSSLYNTAAYSISAQLFPQNIALAYSVLQASHGAGRMVGPGIGGVLYNAGGFPLPFFVTGAMLLVFGFLSTIVLRVTMSDDASGAANEEAAEKKKEGEKAISFGLLHFFKNSVDIWIITIVLSFNSLAHSFPQTCLSVYYETLGLTDPAAVGLVFVVASVIFSILSLIVGKFSDSYPHRIYPMMLVGAVIVTGSLMLYGPMPPLQTIFPPSIALTTIAHVLLCIGTALIINAIPAAIVLAARKTGFTQGLETSAMVASLFNSMWYAGGFAGGPLSGLLMDTVGFAWAAFVVGLISVTIIILLLVGIFLPHLQNCFRREKPLSVDVDQTIFASKRDIIATTSHRLRTEKI